MTDNTDNTEQKRPLSLTRPGGRLELRKPIEAGQVRQSFPHGRSKTVTVEVRKKRTVTPEERAGRVRALQGAIKADTAARKQAVVDVDAQREEDARCGVGLDRA